MKNIYIYFKMKLLLFYLTDNRRHYTFPHFIQMLSSLKNKAQVKLLILTHTNDDHFYYEFLKYTGFDFLIENVHTDNNYLRKVYFACNYAQQNGFEYMMKCDNDIFIKSQTLDYMIENLHLLENSRHLTIGPVLTSGIPTVEYFKEDFLDTDANCKLNSLFLTTNFENRDGAEYTNLNTYTLYANQWDKNAFFESVRSINHHYKGTHPIRVNTESLDFLNNYIIQNKTRFTEDKDLSIISNDDSPYLCNSVFCIKTDTYKAILTDSSLYVDLFDEVPLNKYAWKNNMNHLFVKNGYAIHMYYNWTPNHMSNEQNFCRDFFNI
jgi:hypothetical protein